MIRRTLWFLVGVFVVVLFALSMDAARAAATQTYLAFYTISESNNLPGCVVSTPTEGNAASAVNSLGSSCEPAGWSAAYHATYVLKTVGVGTWSSGYGQYSQGFVVNLQGDLNQTHSGILTATLTCPNGGSFNATYPGWCVVNGLPPPPPSNGASDPACQSMLAENQHGPTMIYTPAGSGTANSNAIQPSDVHGSDGVSYCALEATGQPMAFDKAGNAWWFGWVTGDLYSGSVSPAGSESSGGTACASSGATQVCQSGPPNSGNSPVPGAPSSQLTVGNSNVQLPGSIPNDSCVTTASGAYFCAVGAVQPNNGASPPAPATPDVTITTAAPSSSTNVAPGPSYNLYGPGTVGLSTNYGPGAGSSSTGKSTSTTCTTTNGTQTCTTSATTSASASTATWPSPAFPAGTSPNASIAGAANAIQNSPLVLAASGAIAQTVPAGSCPSWLWNSTLFHTSFDFSNGPAGVCTLANNYSGTLMAVFAAMWVIFGALIILSA